MSVGSVGSSSFSYSLSGLNNQTEKTRKTITKDDLSKMEAQMKASGQTVPDFLSVMEANFDEIDTNGDGASFDEMQTYAKANGLKLQPPPKGPVQGGNGDGPPSLAMDDLVKMRDEMAAAGDSAADGLNQVINQFDSADTDQDGKISFEEMQKFAKVNGISMPQPGDHGASTSSGSLAVQNAQTPAATASSKRADSLFSLLQQQSLLAYSTYSSIGEGSAILGVGLTA
jgi:hypothetical protein